MITGCWCRSLWGWQKDCVRVYTEANSCKGQVGPLRAYSVYGKIEVTARCADIRSSDLMLAGINVTRVERLSLLQKNVSDEQNVTEPFAPASFRYMHLHQSCDALLLMGGLGVETCARPSYRDPMSHDWRGKVPLPSSFIHGTQLSVSCWKERFQPIRLGFIQPNETLHCVNGNWYNTLQLPELSTFSCEPCVLVGGHGYSRLQKANQQELYYFSRLSMRVFTELGKLANTNPAPNRYCLQKDYPASNASGSPASNASGSPVVKGKMILESHVYCNEILAIALVGSAEVEERHLELLSRGEPDNNQCLEAVPAGDGVSPALVHKTCDLESAQQLISPMAIPEIMWNMHKEADRTADADFHKAFGSYCGAHGALSSLAFGQVFGGDDGPTTPKSTCHFAPVIIFGEFLDTTITYDKRSADWPEWNTLLADSPVLCPEGEALTGFRLQQARNVFRYECSRIGGLGASFEYFTAQVEVKKFEEQGKRENYIEALRMIKVDCGENSLLSGFHFEFSEGGRWARSKYTCSKAGGAPVVMEPSTAIESLSQEAEGIFCPFSLDGHTGRFRYANNRTGDILLFQKDGSWCVDADCSLPVGGAGPLGVKMSIFEVVNVTDFDGKFEGKGVPKLEQGGMDDLMRKLKAIKPPTRPKPPKNPKLQEFKAEMPKYDARCLDYQDLWKSVTETHMNAEHEEVVEESRLEADEGTEGKELADYHPCEVKDNSGGKLGRWGGGDGKEVPDGWLYDTWNKCMDGDITRARIQGRTDYADSLYDTVADIVQNAVKLVCAAVPGIEIAPLGAGVEADPPNICGEIVDFVRSAVDIPIKVGTSTTRYWLSEEGRVACNPFQLGYASLFCDVHCLRDAVIRGDRTILRNLEQATKISNDNMKKMLEWSTEAARTESEYLDKKIDHNLKVQSIYLHHIAQNTQPVFFQEKESLQHAMSATTAMLGELRGFADASSFSASGVVAKDALERFVKTAEPLTATNSTARQSQVSKFQSQMVHLYKTMRTSAGGMTKADVVGRQVASQALQLQDRMAKQARVLGVYRAHSHASHKASKAWKQSGAETSLVMLDALWWRMRGKMDRYLDVAADEIAQFQQSLDVLANFQSCKAGTLNLLQSYKSSASKMQRSHRQLRAVWRETSNLMGELAAVISDGDVFGRLMQVEGCSSTLAMQTMDQARLALQSCGFLIHRFEVSGMPEPDSTALQYAVKQIHDAYASAKSFCQKQEL